MVTARGMKTPFIWIQHVGPAKTEGLPDEVVEQVLHGDVVTAEIDQLYQAVWQMARHVVAQEVIPEELQNRIIAEVGTRQLVELVAVCGFYRFIASIAVGFDVPLPPHEGDLPF
jgi:4-carboxymuconolactone decarboxylase